MTINNFIIFWENLFFEQNNFPSLGIFRILIGAVCLFKIISLFHDRYEYFGVNGFYPYKSWQNDFRKNVYFSIFHYLKPNNFSVDLIIFLGLMSSLLLTLGLFTEFSCLTTFLVILSLNNRNLFIFNSGDCLLRIMLFLLTFSGCGYYISFDNIIYNRNQLDNLISPWVFRLMQFDLLCVYFHSVYAKINKADSWINGTGVHYSLSNKIINRFNLNLYLNKYCFIILNYGVLFAESILVLGLIFEETSTTCIVLLIIMHIMFEILIRLNYFGLIMIACLLLFLNNNIIMNLSKNLNNYNAIANKDFVNKK